MNMVSHIYFFIIAVCGWLLAFIIGFLFVSSRQRTKKDLILLLDFIKRTANQHVICNENHAFYNSLIRRVWDNVKLLRINLAYGEAERKTYGEVLNLSVDMAASGDRVDQSCEKLIELLRIVGPEIVAASVVLKNDDDEQQSSRLNVQALWGIPAGRIEDTLLEHFSELIDDTNSTFWSNCNAWGYVLPEKRDKYLDFSAFDIGITLTVPLEGIDGVIGGMWLGFKKGAASLSPERKVFLQCVARHAAATLYAARTAHKRNSATLEQRDFIIGMSHDLRAPGNNALYGIRALLSGDSSEFTKEQYKDIQLIERALEEQQAILGDLFDYAKSDSGILDAKISKHNLFEAIKDLLESFASSALRNKVEFYVEGLETKDANSEIYVLVDLRHLRRIVSNLLSNAFKYTDSGHIRVYCKFCKSIQAGHNNIVELRVEDTGIGVPLSVTTDELFCKFKRQHNVNNRQGAGLGLAVTKLLAERNGGYVIFERNQLYGSTFGVGFISANNISCAQCASNELTFDNVLIAENDEPTRLTMMRYLKPQSNAIFLASNCKEAKDLLNQTKTDLIITDFELEDGLATSFLSTVSNNIPVVICSGMSHLRQRFPEVEKENITVIEKPVSKNELLDAVSKAANGYF